MKKMILLISILFIILTFLGAIYIIYHGGKVSAGYAVIPMIFAVASMSFFRRFY